MTRGESLKVLVDYDLYGTNIKDTKVIFIKIDEATQKCLVYSSLADEWAELQIIDVERLKPDHVTQKNKKFVDRIKTMVYTYG